MSKSNQRDADFWLSEENMKKAPEGLKGFFQGAQASLNSYVKAGKFKAFEGNTDLVPGVKAQATHGHTPDHTFKWPRARGRRWCSGVN